MKKHLSGSIVIIICICFMPGAALSCTTFVIDNNGSPVYGKNMDWIPVPAYVMVNKRGVSKATVPSDNGTAAAWTSKYGSITFNWQARELPFEGINEAGLFISAMGFWDLKKFPETDERPGMLVDQWIQYQLDNYSTLDEVILSDRDIRIEGPWFHFLVSDRQGNCAIIEFPYGEMLCYTGEAQPVKVLTNTAYDQSLAELFRFKGFGGRLPVSRSDFWKYVSKPANSYFRFVRTADMLRQYDSETTGSAVDYAFRILDNVTMVGRKRAVWQSVYDIDNGKIYFQSYYNDAVRSIDINAFDFSCSTPVKVLDVNAELAGDVTGSFVDYTESMSREMLESNRETPLLTLSDEYIEFWTTYSENYTHCTE